ncbi:hypothetical protein FA95DRAFT_1568200 [Auriscalpium vulgare]|uniref:Uncharacterized protein n=1 Tax=Auriscalpium vulgare TaxID=40419 RepID=A0ACB8SCF5_9AGAM|nr:hypothetical protein FA95DRAFT_1568200 [Auriscalpium vulgare]
MVFFLQPIDLAAHNPRCPPHPYQPYQRQPFGTYQPAFVPPQFHPPLRQLPALHVPVYFPVPELDPPSSPSDLGSPTSTLAPPTPTPEFVHVVCNAPLLAPKPLPYRSPAFLDSLVLPDIDEDLSHSPCTPSARSKRKRARDDPDHDPAAAAPAPPKRRATDPALRNPHALPRHGLVSQRRRSG